MTTDAARPTVPMGSVAPTGTVVRADDLAVTSSTGPATGPRRMRRRAEGRLLAGVAGGVADHLGLDPLHVRVTFALLTALSGFGLVLYAALWIFIPLRADGDDASPEPAGLAAARRTGRRPGGGPCQASPRAADAGQLVALGALAAGTLLLLTRTALGVPVGVAAPLLLAAAGVGLVWTLGEDGDRARMAGLPARVPGLSTWTSRTAGPLVRGLLGAALVAAAVVTFLAGRGELASAGDGLLATAVALLGVLVVAAPFLVRLVRERDAARRARTVEEERADVAAHLHDSVLQTLALLQQQAGDPRAVVRIARAQERELRDWLYGTGGAAPATLAAALREAAAGIEEAHGVPVEVVTVGDAPLTEATAAAVAAAREAMANAARHSGAPAVDVFAETGDGGVEVFVRDRGRGFDPDDVPVDRLGVRRSILDRVERHGGRAAVRSAPGEGTEVRIAVGATSRSEA